MLGMHSYAKRGNEGARVAGTGFSACAENDGEGGAGRGERRICRAYRNPDGGARERSDSEGRLFYTRAIGAHSR